MQKRTRKRVRMGRRRATNVGRRWSVSKLRHPCDLSSEVQPKRVIPYFDKVQAWSKTHLSAAELAHLRDHCTTVHRMKKKPRFNRGQGYCEFLVLRQPDDEALNFLAQRQGLLVNLLEVALDWIFESEDERDHASDLVAQLHVKKWRRPGMQVRLVGSTRYSDPRGASNNFVLYPDKACRITGDQYCVHLEWRMRLDGIKSLHLTAEQLIRFDHFAFWERRLLFFDVDRRELGRLCHNRLKRSKRRGAWITQFRSYSYDHDVRAGATIFHVLRSTQSVIDELGGFSAVKRALIPVLCPAGLLPARPRRGAGLASAPITVRGHVENGCR